MVNHFKTGTDRPNVLWIITEDIGPWLGCYGEPLVRTPNLDALAQEGVRFSVACSNAPMCSAARSTLFTGIYSCALATETHRSVRAVPSGVFFPEYLRRAGYWCTHAFKTDYNTPVPDGVWDDQHDPEGYLKRAAGQPFFHVYSSLGETHMGRVATLTTEGRSGRRISPELVKVPERLPDLPEIRDDRAWHLDSVETVDGMVGEFIAKLKRSGEWDRTIVFFFSDHGGCWPGGKGFLHETGLRIPLIIRAPERYRHLLPAKAGEWFREPVAFVDFAPTIFQMTGVPAPDYLQGVSFGAGGPIPRPPVLGFRGQQMERWDPSRSLCDGRYKYLRHFIPHRAWGLRQSYHWRMPGQRAWDETRNQGTELQKGFWKFKPAEELYDLESDPGETKNLANDPEHRARLSDFRQTLASRMREVRDLGLFPESMRVTENGESFKERMDQRPELREALIALAESQENLGELKKHLFSKEAVLRYWALVGLVGKAYESGAGECVAEMIRLLDDPEMDVRMAAAEGLIVLEVEKERALEVLFEGMTSSDSWIEVNAASAIETLGSRAAGLRDRLRQRFESGADSFVLRSVLVGFGDLSLERLFV